MYEENVDQPQHLIEKQKKLDPKLDKESVIKKNAQDDFETPCIQRIINTII
jgi:hypothetical protein